MPHLQIQYSANLDEAHDIGLLCSRLAQEIEAIGPFPQGGVRVRASAMAHYCIADSHPRNAFVDMIFRIGEGRTAEQKRESGKRIMAAAEGFFAAVKDGGHLAISLEIVEISARYSWKTNSIHRRLSAS